MTQNIALTIALADNPHVRALKDASIPIQGVDAQFVNVVPQIAAFRRMVRNLEFDICELAPTTYLIARSLGAPFIALPIFLMRHFHHSGLLVRPDSQIRQPKDLEGKKVGVRAYTVTSGVWTRGILNNEYGVDNSKITWVVDDEEHVREVKLPPNVVHVAEGKSLSGMMASGEIDAGLAGNAGVGRSGSPTQGGWQQEATTNYPELFDDARALEIEWYQRTHIYPMHGTLVVKESVLKEHPFVARALFEAFSRAKNEWLERLRSGAADAAKDRKYRELAKIVGDDPLPYGMEKNMPTIRALMDMAVEQKFLQEPLPLERAFLDPEAM